MPKVLLELTHSSKLFQEYIYYVYACNYIFRLISICNNDAYSNNEKIQEVSID